MGEQAAAALAAGGPLGDVLPERPVAGTLRLRFPDGSHLRRTALSHGGVGLAPSAWDGVRLSRVLRLPGAGAVPVVVAPAPEADLPAAMRPAARAADMPAAPDAGRAGSLVVSWPVPLGERDVAAVQRQLGTVLGLDDDLSALHDACDRLPALRWVRPAGAGRPLRAPTAFEDLVGALAQTNASYAASRRMLRGLAGEGPLPTPEELARWGEDRLRALGWGYRAAYLSEIARRVADGRVDPEAWRDPQHDDEQVLAAVRALPGVGPFAAAQLLPLLGSRPRPVVLDGWLRRRLGGLTDAEARQRYAPLGRWAGTGMWLDVSAVWLA